MVWSFLTKVCQLATSYNGIAYHCGVFFTVTMLKRDLFFT